MSSTNFTSKLLRLSSHDATTIFGDSNSSFEVDLGQNFPEMLDGVEGISVESWGFVNCFPNIKPTKGEEQKSNVSRLYLVPTLGGAPLAAYTIDVPPRWFTMDELLIVLNAGLAGWPYPGGASFTLDTSLTFDPRVIFNMTATAGVVDGLTLRTSICDISLAQYLGWKADPTVKTATPPDYLDVPLTTVIPTVAPGAVSANAPFCPQLQGEQVAYLHSALLMGPETSIDGEGVPNHMMTSCPITVPQMSPQSCFPNQYQEPTILRGRPVESHRIVGISLRDSNGRLLNTGAGQLWANIRIWYYHQA